MSSRYTEGEVGEGEVAFFCAKRWGDRRNRVDLIEFATPCHDAHVVGSYRVSNPLRLTVPRGGGASSIVKVPGDVPPTRVYFLEPLV